MINARSFESIKVPENPENSFKCRLCSVCNGWGCIGQLPGLGGVNQNKNFQLNCAGWKNLRENHSDSIAEIQKIQVSKDNLRCGPVTGAVQNIGYKNESDFYEPYFKSCEDFGIGICVGDGYPDEKLLLGIKAVDAVKSKKSAFFFKPYPIEVLKKRVELVGNRAAYMGMDIDSYNILTMQNLVHLEKKSAEDLIEFRSLFNQPFVIKGIFLDEDVELVKKVKPEVVFISNHGGRIETREGSTAEFLEKYSSELKNYCKEIWVDGGIRTKLDIQTAMYFGASKVIVARPFLKALFMGGQELMTKEIEKFLFIPE